MVTVDVHKGLEGSVNPSPEHLALREERRRTGRYVAAGTAIFLCLLGAYQALINGTPEFAALFAPAVIMFIYVLWILYTSRHQQKQHMRIQNHTETTNIETEEIQSTQNKEPQSPEIVVLPTTLPKKENQHMVYYNRSYSVA